MLNMKLISQTTVMLLFFAWGFGVGAYYIYKRQSSSRPQASALHSPQ